VLTTMAVSDGLRSGVNFSSQTEFDSDDSLLID
jgi:hypothetical protein